MCVLWYNPHVTTGCLPAVSLDWFHGFWKLPMPLTPRGFGLFVAIASSKISAPRVGPDLGNSAHLVAPTGFAVGWLENAWQFKMLGLQSARWGATISTSGGPKCWKSPWTPSRAGGTALGRKLRSGKPRYETLCPGTQSDSEWQCWWQPALQLISTGFWACSIYIYTSYVWCVLRILDDNMYRASTYVYIYIYIMEVS